MNNIIRISTVRGVIYEVGNFNVKSIKWLEGDKDIDDKSCYLVIKDNSIQIEVYDVVEVERDTQTLEYEGH